MIHTSNSIKMVFNNGKVSYRHQTNALNIFISKGAILLDVRTIHEYYRTKIPGAKHAALEDLQHHIDTIKSWNAPIITYCNYGEKSQMATRILKAANIEVINGGAKEDLIKLLQKKEAASR